MTAVFNNDFLDNIKATVMRNEGMTDSLLYFPYDDAVIALQRLAGDASHKMFFRFVYAGSTFVALIFPPGLPSSEEIFMPPLETHSQGAIFAQTAQWLMEVMPSIPAVVAVDACTTCFILADAGDTTLADVASRQVESAVLPCYRLAIDWLVMLAQQQPRLSASSVIKQRVFNEEALLHECMEFAEFSPSKDVACFIAHFESLAQLIGAQPQTIIHRDYQSRNILLDENNTAFWVIDQQDMCMGSLYYDVASLLIDPYVTLSDTFIKHCIDYFITQVHQHGLNDASFDTMRRGIKLCCLQRCLKAAGRYQRLFALKNNSAYLPYYDVAVSRAQRLQASLSPALTPAVTA